MGRATIATVAVFLLLATGVLLLERLSPAPPANPTTYVLEARESDVQRLEIQTAAGRAAFEREEPVGWKFANSAEQADMSRVNSVANRLARLRSSAQVGENISNLEPYGLVPPAHTATLTMKDGTTHRILIGNRTPNEAAYYAILEGATTLHTINTLLVGDVEKLVIEPPVPTTPTPLPTATATPAPQERVEPTVGLPAPTLDE